MSTQEENHRVVLARPPENYADLPEAERLAWVRKFREAVLGSRTSTGQAPTSTPPNSETS